MKQKVLILSIITALLITGINYTADAQLGGLRKKAEEAAKGAAKDAKESTKESTKESAKETTKDAAKTTTESAAQSVELKASGQLLKPSSEAIAADPRASINTVEDGYSRTPAQIRGAYEALSERYFRPYYNSKLRRFYLLDDSKAELEFFENSAKTLDAFRSHCRKESYFYQGKIMPSSARENASQNYSSFNSSAWSIIDTIPAGNRTPWECYDDCIGVLPTGIHVVYAGYALFKADPQGLKPFMRFVEARNARAAFYSSIISVKGGSDGKTLMTGEKLPVKWNDLIKVCDDTYELEQLAKNVTPISVIKETATFYRDQLAKYDAAKDIRNTRYYFHLFELAMYYWQENNKVVKDASDYDNLFLEYVRYSKRCEEWAKAALADRPPVDMPKTFKVDATLQAKALETAKTQFTSFKVDKVVFLSDDWAIAKQANYPYHVTQRAHTVAFLTNENGKWIMRQPWRFVQPSDSKGGWVNKYSYQAGMSGDPNRAQPVNYKP